MNMCAIKFKLFCFICSRAILFYSMSGIIPMGLIFNTVSVIVFMSRPMRKRAASWYLASLAISDNIALITFTIDTWMTDDRIGLQLNYFVCVSGTYMSYASRLFSAILVTSFTVERFIGVVYPLKRAILSSTSHAWKVIGAAMVVSLTATSFTWVTMHVVSEDDEVRSSECDIMDSRADIYIAFVIFYIIGSIVIPIVVICSLNSFILFKICERKKTIAKNSIYRGGLRTGTGRTTRRSYNIATMLLVVSTSFVLLNLPYCFTFGKLLVEVYALHDFGYESYAAKYITTVPYYLNYAINLLLYSLCARAFRVQMVRVLCIFRRDSYMTSYTKSTRRTRYAVGTRRSSYRMSSRTTENRPCGQMICHKMLLPFSDNLPQLGICGAQHVSSTAASENKW